MSVARQKGRRRGVLFYMSASLKFVRTLSLAAKQKIVPQLNTTFRPVTIGNLKDTLVTKHPDYLHRADPVTKMAAVHLARSRMILPVLAGIPAWQRIT
jgi:hypothetical protein